MYSTAASSPIKQQLKPSKILFVKLGQEDDQEELAGRGVGHVYTAVQWVSQACFLMTVFCRSRPWHLSFWPGSE